MKLYDVDGYDRPLMLSEEHAEQIGAVEHVAEQAVPTRNAIKATWVEYAISQGADPDLAERATKSELVDEYGGD